MTRPKFFILKRNDRQNKSSHHCKINAFMTSYKILNVKKLLLYEPIFDENVPRIKLYLFLSVFFDFFFKENLLKFTKFISIGMKFFI